ncbi:efflux RND transporter periplasmic adaptor subunit [Robertmurraya massiliosenegalensis]|uniref:efflux RND transporter periplasmic adaptor subunit n=1 Tax=Robertmurraya TaxID=2837507 RepID=UPI0039A61F39
MNWKKWTAIIFIALFVAVNFYLLLKKDSEIARSEYINEWRTVQKQNLVLSTERAGVVAPAEEEYVYFQQGAGDFEQFFVKVGDQVSTGTPLFEYSPRNLEATIEQFEAEITKLQSEQYGLQENIRNLESIERGLRQVEEDEENPSNQAVASTIEAQIYEKELQLSRIEAEIDKFEELIANSNSHLGSLTVDSPIAGMVKEISHHLQNPVVTITSTDQHVKGLLAEEDLQEIQEGMKVIVSGSFGKMDGVISKVSVTPEDDPQVGVKSEYEFVVQLQEPEENSTEDLSEENLNETETEEASQATIYTGSHVSVKIITEEVEDALTLPRETNRLGDIYVLKSNGTIEKRPVQMGITINGVYEITSEAEEGELVVNEPTRIRNNTSFFTPLVLSEMSTQELKEMGKKEILKYLGRGLLNR